jgi:hypothetical protein
MLKCSFCGHPNADGLHFCEKCKTDLTIPATTLFEPSEPTLAELPLFLEPGKTDTDVPTLHFDKIPLVETLGRSGDGTDLATTRAAAAQQLAYAPTVPTVAADSGAINSMPGSHPATALEDSPESGRPRLVVLRGEKLNMQYAIYPGKNYLGRTDDKPVDIDLENQEPPDRIWTSRQHAVIAFENGLLTIEDLNSLNGTFVNRTRVHPGQIRTLQPNDIIQLGTVQLRVLAG